MWVLFYDIQDCQCINHAFFLNEANNHSRWCENRFLPSQITDGREQLNKLLLGKAFLGALAGCGKVGIYYGC